MAQQPNITIDNNFAGGLITEASGLNFPPNAVVASQNCIHTILGTVERRNGMDFEPNFQGQTITRTGVAVTGYLWRNVNGDGNVFLYVLQVGDTLYFYNVTTDGTSVSQRPIAATISLTMFSPSGAPDPGTLECQFSSGQGFLFVTHPNLEAFAVQYVTNSQTFVTQQISLLIRDFTGIFEPGVTPNFRPPTLTNAHNYNLQNQGWTTGGSWSATSTSSVTAALGHLTFTVQAGLSISNGQNFTGFGAPSGGGGGGTAIHISGTVFSYSGTTLILNVVTCDHPGSASSLWSFSQSNSGFITTWFTAEGNYPSNSDIWFTFKDTMELFNPAATAANISLQAGQAPQGHFILNAFNQDRSAVSSVSGFTPVSSGYQRPTTSAFFAGRIWFSGTNYPSFSNNIYFSQILNTNDTNDVTAINFGNCYQNQDPTAETASDLLPDDGGVIKIADCGTIFKLFPIQGALLVFASNGIWTVTGSQGLGFSANDYSVNKLSAIRCLSSTSFVDVLGFPMFWAREGIYTIRVDVTAGGLRIDSLTDTTIRSFYNDIPQASKLLARGYYNPIEFTVQWLYRTTTAGSVTDSYNFDGILNFNVLTGAFFPWTFKADLVAINGVTVVDVANTGQENFSFKYLVSYNSNNFTFAETRDTTYQDWKSVNNVGEGFTSTLTGAYKLKGQGGRRFQIPFLYIFMDSSVANQYNIQGWWDFAIDPNKSKQSPIQTYGDGSTDFLLSHKRWKIRGRGLVLQFNIFSQPNKPMNLTGWSVWEAINSGP